MRIPIPVGMGRKDAEAKPFLNTSFSTCILGLKGHRETKDSQVYSLGALTVSLLIPEKGTSPETAAERDG